MVVVFFRTLIVFFSLLFAMRLMGKRQLGELELSELVIAVLISDLASHPLQDIGIPLLNGLLPIFILLCCELLLSGFMVKSNGFKKLICGKPSIIIQKGVINQKEMIKNRVTIDELMDELRKKSILDISKIEYGILETDGMLNVILFPAERPVTAQQLSIKTDDTGFPVIVINNGKILEDNLRISGKDEAWLEKQLQEHKVKSAKDVFLMSVNSYNQIYFAAKEEKK